MAVLKGSPGAAGVVAEETAHAENLREMVVQEAQPEPARATMAGMEAPAEMGALPVAAAMEVMALFPVRAELTVV